MDTPHLHPHPASPATQEHAAEAFAGLEYTLTLASGRSRDPSLRDSAGRLAPGAGSRRARDAVAVRVAPGDAPGLTLTLTIAG